MDNLKKATFNGMLWKFAERFLAQTVSLVVSIILARLLIPDDYSVVSIVTIFFTFANVIISGGLNTALIQKKNADIIDYSSVLHVSVILSIVIYAILFFCAPFIAGVYQKEILTPIIRVMGLTIIVDAIKSILCAYTSSNFQFKKFFWATFVGTLISAVVGITMAYNGFGAWSLVAQQMTNTCIDTIVLFFSTKIKFVARISWERVKTLFQYGWKIFVASLITEAYGEASPLIIGLKYSTTDLAFYTKGRSFPSLINQTVSQSFAAVLFPVMSKIQDDKAALLEYTRRFIRLASFLIFPMMLGFCAVSDNFISLLLTDKWLPASIYVKIFSFAYMFDIIQVGNLYAIKALGRSDINLILEIIKKSCYAIVILAFVFFTNEPELLAVAAVCNTVIATVCNTYPNRKLIDYKYRYQIRDIFPNFVTSAIMCVIVYMLGYLHLNKLPLLIVQIVAGAIIYVCLNILIKNENQSYFICLIKEMIHKTNGTK